MTARIKFRKTAQKVEWAVEERTIKLKESAQQLQSQDLQQERTENTDSTKCSTQTRAAAYHDVSAAQC